MSFAIIEIAILGSSFWLSGYPLYLGSTNLRLGMWHPRGQEHFLDEDYFFPEIIHTDPDLLGH